MASSKETYCLCGQPYINGQFMIECDCCREWFHGSCVDVKIYQSDDIDKYHCPKCVQTYGPSVLKIPTNNHRADRYEVGAEGRPAQCGSPEWVRAIQARPLRPTPASLMRMKGHQFTEEFIRDNGFTRPVLFHSQEGLDMKTPNPATFTVRSVLRYCGAQMDVEVIDVRRQATLRMPLGDLVEYLERPPEGRADKVLNVLSLEFSESGLSAVVEAPRIARSLDWATRVWPPAEERPPRPSVSRYCLMSAAGSYTDFHVDFGGTTVWYHVLHGRKLFYLVPPTAANLALYQQWCASNNQTENFFGDMVEWYGTAELCAGQTLFIPTGWIHAVLTPVDSLVFGGNFLHSYAIEMQLQIYEIERRVETPILLRYPLFEAMNWYAGAHLLTMLRRHNEETQDEEFTLSERSRPALGAPLPALLLRGLKLLAAALKEWHALKPTDAAKRDNVPKCLNSGQLVRELSKELRTLEKRSTSLANKDKDFKIKNNTSPTKAQRKQQSVQKKSLKLTLPKPIMHMGNGEFAEEKVYADKLFIDNKEVIFQDGGGRYVALPDAKYVTEKEVLPEKYTYHTYEEPVQGYQDTNGYNMDKKTLKIKLNNSPSHRDEPPPYSLPEHSILKSHLIRNSTPLKPIQQWTISKGDYQEQILFTNENVPANVRMDTADIQYGAGMYSAEDIQPEYQYSETKPQYQPEYGYSGVGQDVVTYVDGYQRYEEVPVATNLHQNSNYETLAATDEQLNGGYSHDHLPSYDAAIAQQYHTTNYVVEETKAVVEVAAEPASSPVAVRRSERPVRRRVSNTYDYEDGDLYIDETPAPRRRRHAAKQRHAQPQAPHTPQYRHTAPPAAAASSSNSGYRRPAPVNGIESLIQASVIADEEPTRDTEDAAVAGMLSIGEQRYTAPQRTFGLAQDTHKGNNSSTPGSSSSKRTRKSTAAASSADEDLDEEDVIKEVHRDEEYVYPSLEMSSDDDEEWSASRRRRNSRNKVDAKAKGEKDESWSPRARLGRLVPRLRGPARAGVRRECVRAALHAAAHHPAHPAHPTHPAHVPHKAHEQSAKRAVLATKSKRPPPPQHSSSASKNSRLKKGMKTAKQRLGKILKIHKMIY